MSKLTVALSVAAMLAFTSPAMCVILDLPLDTVESWFVVGGDMTATAMTEGDRTFIRCQPLEDNAWPGNWFYFPSIRLNEANGGNYVDASAPNTTLEFDVRYYQEGEGAYDNANIGIQIISKNPDTGEMWLSSYFKVGQSPPDDPPVGGEWYHLVIDLHAPIGNLDPEFIEKMELHGAYDRNLPQDYIDIDNMVIRQIPEPGTLALISFGLLGLLGIRRKK